MTDSAISGLTAVTTPAATDEYAVNQGGTSKKTTLAQINAYNDPVVNAAIAPVTGYAGGAYMVGSGVAYAAGRLQVKTIYTCAFNIVKTAAGIVAPSIDLRIGPSATLTDTARVTLTFGAQTAVIDSGMMEVWATFIAVGAATGQVQFLARLTHQLATTGLSVTATSSFLVGTSATFDTTPAAFIGLALNAGTSASWTTTVLQAQLLNLL